MSDTYSSSRGAAEITSSPSTPKPFAFNLLELGPGHTLQRVWAVFLAAGLLFAVPGCDSGGANGGDDGDDGGGQTVVPAAPSGLEATSADGEVSLNWEAADDAQTYNVYRDTESDVGASGDPLEDGIDGTSYTDGTAENGTTYYYVVTGVADEEGDPSGEVEKTPFSEPPNRPN